MKTIVICVVVSMGAGFVLGAFARVLWRLWA